MSEETPRPRLVGVAGRLVGHQVEVEDGLTLGRDPSNQVVLVDPSVSRRHCRIRREGPDYRLEDLGSRHGTYVNGYSRTDVVLAHEDRIAVGESVFVFRLSGEDEEAGDLALHVSDTLTASVQGQRLRLAESPLMQPARILRSASERTLRDLETLRRISTAVNTLADPVELARRVLELCSAAVPAARGGILLLARAAGPAAGPLRFEPLASWGRASGAERHVPVSRTVAEQAVRERTAVLHNEVRELAPFADAPSLAAAAVRSVLCVPLAVFDRPIGVLYLDTSEAGVRFDVDHLKLVTAIASMVALPLESARHGEPPGSVEETTAEEQVPWEEVAREPEAGPVERAVLVFRSLKPLHLGNVLAFRSALDTIPASWPSTLGLFLDYGVEAGRAGTGSFPTAWLGRLAILPGAEVACASQVPSIARLTAGLGATLRPGAAESGKDARAWFQELLLAAALVVSRATHALVEPVDDPGPPDDPDPGRGLELARLLASRINKRLERPLPRPVPLLTGFRSFLSLDGKGPMGATERGAILLVDSPESTLRKVRTARTDDRPVLDPRAPLSPEVRNLLLLHHAVTGEPTGSLLARMAGKGYGTLKQELGEAVNAFLAPYRERLKTDGGMPRVTPRVHATLERSGEAITALLSRVPGEPG